MIDTRNLAEGTIIEFVYKDETYRGEIHYSKNNPYNYFICSDCILYSGGFNYIGQKYGFKYGYAINKDVGFIQSELKIIEKSKFTIDTIYSKI
jgi:hypothetical protein